MSEASWEHVKWNNETQEGYVRMDAAGTYLLYENRDRYYLGSGKTVKAKKEKQ